MDATATLSLWKKFFWPALMFAALFLCSFAMPPTAILLALTLPLLAGPLYAHGDIWLALSLPLAPMIAYLAGGGDVVIAALLPVFAYLCLLIIFQNHRRRLPFGTQAIGFGLAFAVAATGMLARLAELLGGPLFPQLADSTVNMVQNSYLSGNILYRLAVSGFYPVPEAYRTTDAFQMAIWLNPVLRQELINMLRLRLLEGFSQWIPALLMHGSVLLGLFTALGTERAASRREPDASAPAFRDVALSRSGQGYMLALCLGVVVTSFVGDGFRALLGTLLYNAFTAIYQVLGAAVLVWLMSRRKPSRAPLYGFLAAVLYVLLPIALFLLGIVDQFLHLRTAGLHHQEEE